MMTRLDFIKRISRVILLGGLAVFTGYIYNKNGKKSEFCDKELSISSCDKCKLLKNCNKNQAVDFRLQNTQNVNSGAGFNEQ